MSETTELTPAQAALAINGGSSVVDGMLDYRRGARRIGDAERAAIVEVIDSQSLFRYYGADLRNKVESFERGVEQHTGAAHAVATSSGTSALLAGLAALGVGPGDEVIVPAVTFIATANAVVIAGAVPIFCEVDATLGLDPAHLETLINERTAAIMPVHLENVVCAMEPILEIAASHNVPVIEDACQAMGSSYKGRQAGTFGAIGTFSLQLEKNITAGEGGVVVSNDGDLFTIAARYTDQGGQFVTSKGSTRGEADLVFVGENLRMSELGGAVAGAQLDRLPDLMASMRRNKKVILDALGAVEGLTLRSIPDPEGDGGSSLIFYVPTADLATPFVMALLHEGIPCTTLYEGKPVYANEAIMTRQTVTPKRSPWAVHPVEVTYAIGMCPQSEDLISRTVAIGIGPDYTEAECLQVAEAIKKVAAALL